MNLIKSTTFKLTLIFAFGFIILTALFQAVVGHSLRQENQLLNAQAAHRMTRFMLVSDNENEIDLERVKGFAKRSQLRFHINSAKIKWFSTEAFETDYEQIRKLNFKKLEIRPVSKRALFTPYDVSVIDFNKKRIYKVETPSVTLLIEIPDNRNSSSSLFFFVALVFLGLMYALTRYLFSPLINIRKVVDEVSNGNLTARTNVNRNDDFGDLANKINNMAEQIQHRVESKHSLLLGISHELRTPLTSARIGVEMLKEKSRRDSVIEDLAAIERIIYELTEAEKLSEHSDIHRTATDINGLINELISQSFSKFVVNTELLPDDPYLNIDSTRIKLLTKNLLSNAIKYTPKGKKPPLLTLSIKKDMLAITVIDDGIGVKSNQVDKLKEPFHRADSARTRETGGYGLGLYLCDVITKAHGGQLELKSDLESGTIAIATIKL